MPASYAREKQLSLRLADGLENVERALKPDVVRIRFSLGEDWSGDPAIFFRIVLSDRASQQDDLAGFTGLIGGKIFGDLRLAELDYIPYFNFRSESEQNRLKNPEWD